MSIRASDSLKISESDEDSPRVNQMKAEVDLLEKKAKATEISPFLSTYMFRAWYFPSVVISFAYVAGSFPASFTAVKWLIFAVRMKSSRIQPQLRLCFPALHTQVTSSIAENSL